MNDHLKSRPEALKAVTVLTGVHSSLAAVQRDRVRAYLKWGDEVEAHRTFWCWLFTGGWRR